MKFRMSLLVTTSIVSFLGANVGNAADLIPPPPPPQYVEVVDKQPSCLYARADVGGAFHERPTVTKQTAVAGSSTEATDEELDKHAFIEAGVGCQLTKNFRVEATAGYRFRASLTTPTNDLQAELQTYTGFVNAFWDITNYNGVTPYLGFGVGIAYHYLSDIDLPVGSRNGGRADLAYNFTAGVSYDLTDSMALDLAYRYVDLGLARSRGSNQLTVDDLTSHEVKLGVRYKFGSW